jgi:hypothetical protein
VKISKKDKKKEKENGNPLALDGDLYSIVKEGIT